MKIARLASVNLCVWVLVFSAVCLFVSLAPSLAAQTAGTGALRGAVTDASGAVIPNVTVTVTSVDTGQVRTAATEADGTFAVNLLPPGKYRVKFEASGFNSSEVASANVNVTETEVINESLQVGTQTQQVTVQGDVETIQTASSALGNVADSKTVTELPLSTRNYTNLLAMAAGANGPVTNASTIGKGSSNIYVNGGGAGQNTYLQDGVAINNWFSTNTPVEGGMGGSFAIPNPDSISEFKIQTSSYDAGYGRNPGSNVNVITKSGTNEFHGAAFEFFRNSVLNANDWFYKRSELLASNPNKPPVLNANTYGGTFGGPVKKNKLFFFISYQESDQKNGLSGYGFSSVNLPPVPILAAGRGTCTPGFSDPATGCGSTTAATQAFITALATNLSPNPGCPNAGVAAFKTVTTGSINVACPLTAIGPTNPVTGTADLYNINPVAISILQLQVNGNYLLPGITGTKYLSGQTYSDPAIFKDHSGLGNFDYTINNANTLSGRYVYDRDPIQAPFPVLSATSIGSFLPGNPATTIKADQSGILRLTSVITANFVNEAHIAYQRYATVSAVLTPLKNSQVGVADLSTVDTLSYFNITGAYGFGGMYMYPGYWPENQFQAADQISWSHGKHTFRAGFEGVSIQLLQDDQGEGIGDPTFQSFNDFLIGRCGNVTGCALPNGGTGSNISSVGAFSVQNSSYRFYFRDLLLNGFVQDDLKINSRLTFNLGLRWEYDGSPTVKGGIMSNIWPSLVQTVPLPPTLAAGGTLVGFVVPGNYHATVPTGVYKDPNNSATRTGAPKDDFAPRVGFAWQPTGDSKWVLRGGFGLFYDVLSGIVLTDNSLGVSSPAIVPPVITGLTTARLANPWQTPALVIPGPPGTVGFTPRFLNPGAAGTGAGAQSSNLSQGSLPSNVVTPVTYEWNLNTQYEFRPSWVLELGYVGSHGVHQETQSTGGIGTTSPYNIAQVVGTGAPCPSCALTGVTTNSVANVVDRVPNLGFSANAVTISNIASYKYNSFQATLRKQFSHGFQLQAAYTWSRGFLSQPYGINAYPYLIYKYGLNPGYRPQRLVVNYIWNLPLGHHDGFLGKATSGWAVSGVTTIQDGSALNITGTNAGQIFCGSSCGAFIPTGNFAAGMGPANVLAGGSLTQRVLNGLIGPTSGTNGYFNSGVFVAPPTSASVGIPTTGTASAFGNAGLGPVLGPGQKNWDMSISKTTNVFREGQSLEFRAEFFNAFNHPQFSNPVVTSNLSSFGQITTTSVSPRILQLALKYMF